MSNRPRIRPSITPAKAKRLRDAEILRRWNNCVEGSEEWKELLPEVKSIHLERAADFEANMSAAAMKSLCSI